MNDFCHITLPITWFLFCIVPTWYLTLVLLKRFWLLLSDFLGGEDGFRSAAKHLADLRGRNIETAGQGLFFFIAYPERCLHLSSAKLLWFFIIGISIILRRLFNGNLCDMVACPWNWCKMTWCFAERAVKLLFWPWAWRWALTRLLTIAENS